MAYYAVVPVDSSSDELMHFGVKGMKWGVRRYVNLDGTLTPEGKLKYGKNRAEIEKAYQIAKKESKEERRKMRMHEIGEHIYATRPGPENDRQRYYNEYKKYEHMTKYDVAVRKRRQLKKILKRLREE